LKVSLVECIFDKSLREVYADYALEMFACDISNSATAAAKIEDCLKNSARQKAYVLSRQTAIKDWAEVFQYFLSDNM
jgi:hypothetical protein